MTAHHLAARLGRLQVHDEASRAYPAATVTPAGSVFHRHRGAVLNQGDLGSCTANALVQALATEPLWRAGYRATEAHARALYHRETELQGGPVYPPADPGGSGLMVCKAGVALGLIRAYTHAFGLDHARGAIGLSPFLVGSKWYGDANTPGMFQPDAAGFVTPAGPLAGGHEYLCLGYDATADAWVFLNSWGKGWGVAAPAVGITSGGAFLMTSATFGRLLADGGDVTCPAV